MFDKQRYWERRRLGLRGQGERVQPLYFIFPNKWRPTDTHHRWISPKKRPQEYHDRAEQEIERREAKRLSRARKSQK